MPTSVRLDPETVRRLDDLAARAGQSRAAFLRDLVARSLEDIEDYYLAEAASNDFHSGKVKAVPLTGASQDLGLDDTNSGAGAEEARKARPDDRTTDTPVSPAARRRA